ncbi:unnamed protein product [Closterium sp. Naga37s-1]|nr:unnamed protein product [Closterium sp. Naga37s-1]
MVDALGIRGGFEIPATTIDFHNVVLSVLHPQLPTGRTWVALASSAYQSAVNEHLCCDIDSDSLFKFDYVCIVALTKCHRDPGPKHASLVVVKDPGLLLKSDEEL